MARGKTETSATNVILRIILILEANMLRALWARDTFLHFRYNSNFPITTNQEGQLVSLQKSHRARACVKCVTRAQRACDVGFAFY